jgi:DNA-binding transcriptional LysR family regulator
MTYTQPEPEPRTPDGAGAPQGLELRHLRYFAALADAGSFTRAAEQIFIAQPTLSQQIRRLEQIVGTPLLHRRHDGLTLTPAGRVLLDASRAVLSRLDHELSRTRQAAGLGRPRLRMVLPPGLPESLALKAAAGLRAAAAAADVDVAWLETALDAEFSLLGTRRADAGLDWLTDGPQAPPAPLEAMTLGEFEPDVWIPSRHAAAQRGTISLQKLAGLDVIHGPRRARATVRNLKNGGTWNGDRPFVREAWEAQRGAFTEVADGEAFAVVGLAYNELATLERAYEILATRQMLEHEGGSPQELKVLEVVGPKIPSSSS